MRDNFRVYLERAHPAFLTTLVVLVGVISHLVDFYLISNEQPSKGKKQKK